MKMKKIKIKKETVLYLSCFIFIMGVELITIKENKDLRTEIANNKITIEQTSQDLKSAQDEIISTTDKYDTLLKQHDTLLKQAEEVENQREILKQELENEKSLRVKAETKARNSLSRGELTSGGSYKVSSRVDVKSGISTVQLEKALKGTKMQGLGEAFVKAEKETGVNAIFLAAIGALESGWGKSNFASSKNNLFGLGSWDNNLSNTMTFSTKEEGILYAGRLLSKNYLTKGGIHYNGATPYGVNVKYCSTSAWKGQVVEIMNLILSRVTAA